jgi:oligoribonuclease NrnB/cAMP/cGMP phosphodiesterase (DHH superfamily)
MKLHEEFKLFENLWDDFEAMLDDEDMEFVDTNFVKSDTTSYWAKVDNSTKKIEAKGVAKNQAFKAITAFILSLTQEEIDNLGINWVYDYHKPGDAAGDPVFQLDSLSEYCEMEECSIDNYDRQDFEENRYPQNWDREDRSIVTALLTTLDLPLWY